MFMYLLHLFHLWVTVGSFLGRYMDCKSINICRNLY